MGAAAALLTAAAVVAGCGDDSLPPRIGTLTVTAYDPPIEGEQAAIDCFEGKGVRVVVRRRPLPARMRGGRTFLTFWTTRYSRGLKEDPSERAVRRAVRACEEEIN